MARQRGVRHESQALACEVLDNHKNAKAAPVREGVRGEVQRPALILTCGTAAGARVPSAHLRPPLLAYDKLTSR
jgi:hypothetical protein